MASARASKVVLWPGMSVLRTLWGHRAILVPLAILFAAMPAWGALAGGAVLLGIVLSSGVLTRPLARRELEAVELDVRGESLVLRDGAGERELPVSAFSKGYVVPAGAAGAARLVIFVGAHVAVDATMESTEAARSLLRELGLSALQRPLKLSFAGFLRVTVGVDGVVVQWPLLGKRRFIPHAQIDDIRWNDYRVTLVLTTGEHYVIGTMAGPGNERHLALLERLRAAREEYQRAERGDALALLSRGGRTAEAWVKELRAIGQGGGDRYRSASLPDEVLWRVALDPAASEEHRIGASLALRPTLDDKGREKLRVAAGSAASPRVRVALSAAVEADDDEAVVLALVARPPQT